MHTGLRVGSGPEGTPLPRAARLPSGPLTDLPRRSGRTECSLTEWVPANSSSFDTLSECHCGSRLQLERRSSNATEEELGRKIQAPGQVCAGTFRESIEENRKATFAKRNSRNWSHQQKLGVVTPAAARRLHPLGATCRWSLRVVGVDGKIGCDNLKSNLKVPESLSSHRLLQPLRPGPRWRSRVPAGSGCSESSSI